MRRSHPGRELFFAKRNLLREVSAEQGEIFRLTVALQRNVHRQHRRKSGDVVVPESALDFRQVGFVQESAIARRLQVDAANFHVQRIFLGSDQQVRADGAQFAINLVANIGGDRNHRRRHGHAKRDGRAGQQFAPLLAPEGFVNEPDEHPLLLFEHAAAGRDVRLLNNHGVSRLRRLERNRIAAARRAHRLRIDGRGAVLANHSVARLVKADRSANLAGIEHRSDFAIRLLIEPETNRRAVLLRLEAVQVAIGNLRQRNLSPGRSRKLTSVAGDSALWLLA